MITVNNTALLVVDIQGKLATLMHDKTAFFSQTRVMIQAAKLLQIPIIWVEQVPDKLGSTAPEIAELLTGYTPLSKSTFSCCGNAQFLQKLESVNPDTVLITGIEAHICVYQTTVGLLRLGKRVHVIADATASRIDANKRIGLQRMQNEGAVISSVEMCLFELLQSAEHEHFRKVSKLIQ